MFSHRAQHQRHTMDFRSAAQTAQIWEHAGFWRAQRKQEACGGCRRVAECAAQGVVFFTHTCALCGVLRSTTHLNRSTTDNIPNARLWYPTTEASTRRDTVILTKTKLSPPTVHITTRKKPPVRPTGPLALTSLLLPQPRLR